MPELVAGKRDKMVWYAMFRLVEDTCDQLGWLDDPVANGLQRQPVEVLWESYHDDMKITANKVVVMPDDIDYTMLECGSNSQMSTRAFVIDIYAESQSIGLHLRGDISAALRGHYSSIGRDNNTLEVMDEDSATPYLAAVMDIENVREDRARGGTEAWERFWFSIMCTVEDEGWTDPAYVSPIDATVPVGSIGTSGGVWT